LNEKSGAACLLFYVRKVICKSLKLSSYYRSCCGCQHNHWHLADGWLYCWDRWFEWLLMHTSIPVGCGCGSVNSRPQVTEETVYKCRISTWVILLSAVHCLIQ